MRVEIETMCRRFLETQDEALRGPILVLLNQEVDNVKSGQLYKAELALKAVRTTLSKRNVQFDVLEWILESLFKPLKIEEYP
jgi:hypothetical protein